MADGTKFLLLRLWRDLPIPRPIRRQLLKALNPRFLLGALALIQDLEGRILLLKHTYRRSLPWGLPGGYVGSGEALEQAVQREVREETGWEAKVDGILAAQTAFGDEVGILFRCTIVAGKYRNSPENSEHGWFPPGQLPPMPTHQVTLLRSGGIV